MKTITLVARAPIEMWVDDIEDGALKQVINLASLPFIHKHVALMPDCHQGYGMPIGGVLATKGVVIPNAVGVDIGCGMTFMATNISVSEIKPYLQQIVDDIRKAVPVGFNRHKEQCEEFAMPDLDFMYNTSVIEDQFENARYQLGTLGGGNHFIEIQKDENEMVCVMIHSGSRNIGKQVADHYNKVAKRFNEQYFSVVPKEYDLAFLPFNDTVGKRYMEEMQYCVDFALLSRSTMMMKVEHILEALPLSLIITQRINIPHNYARIEHHYGKDVVVHRKGATSAKKGEIGIIPGSQGSSSYIVEGLGNPESFMSCSHGAGRRMGRKQAQRELSLADEQKHLNDMGVLHSVRGKEDLDEAPSAYKDIDEVMANQTDLVSIIKKLTPLAVIKG